jgi:hypothetical protein
VARRPPGTAPPFDYTNLDVFGLGRPLLATRSSANLRGAAHYVPNELSCPGTSMKPKLVRFEFLVRKAEIELAQI